MKPSRVEDILRDMKILLPPLGVTAPLWGDYFPSYFRLLHPSPTHFTSERTKRKHFST